MRLEQVPKEYVSRIMKYTRKDIYFLLYFLSKEENQIDYKNKFKAVWGPRKVMHGLSRCMPWGAMQIRDCPEPKGEFERKLIYHGELEEMYNMITHECYIRSGDHYYTLVYEFKELDDESFGYFKDYILNTILVIMMDGNLSIMR